MTADLAPLGAWADLPFFAQTWPTLEAALATEQRKVFPPPDRMFRALELVQPDDVRVVILGQDPYHTAGKADGLAFSIPTHFTGRLDSLGNIFKELRNDLDVTRSRTDLTDWTQQGVLLLNTALSVPEGAAAAHAKIGWQHLVDQILTRLDTAPRAWLLWGNAAQKRAQLLQNANHLLIETAHPSPLSANRGFFGSRPFSQVNEWLQRHQQPPIRWDD